LGVVGYAGPSVALVVAFLVVDDEDGDSVQFGKGLELLERAAGGPRIG